MYGFPFLKFGSPKGCPFWLYTFATHLEHILWHKLGDKLRSYLAAQIQNLHILCISKQRFGDVNDPPYDIHYISIDVKYAVGKAQYVDFSASQIINTCANYKGCYSTKETSANQSKMLINKERQSEPLLSLIRTQLHCTVHTLSKKSPY